MVEWEDAFSDGGWRSFEDDLPAAQCVTVGFLLFDTPDKVIIVQSKSSSGNYADRIAIPKVCIKRIRKLKVSAN
jgi:hypothetical protein